jgi:hypothetical protein
VVREAVGQQGLGLPLLLLQRGAPEGFGLLRGASLAAGTAHIKAGPACDRICASR